MPLTSTLYSALITTVRRRLLETTADFWSDAELLEYLINGSKDLYYAVVDLHQGHYRTIDATNVSLAANSSTLTGVPADCFRIYAIEPRTSSEKQVLFTAKDYNHALFQAARMVDAVDPEGQEILFDVRGPGAPVAAPSVDVAPQVTSAVLLRFVYVPAFDGTSYTAATANPIPGDSDNALVEYALAYARAKDNEGGMPSEADLALYATEKKLLLSRLTPRQEQDSEFVEGMFEEYPWS